MEITSEHRQAIESATSDSIARELPSPCTRVYVSTQSVRRQSASQRRSCGKYVTHATQYYIAVAYAGCDEPWTFFCGESAQGKKTAAALVAMFN
jgi:hypothetical protein